LELRKENTCSGPQEPVDKVRFALLTAPSEGRHYNFILADYYSVKYSVNEGKAAIGFWLVLT
jgi:hypothetical protein